MNFRNACQVVPDRPTFSVDDGFTYLLPEGVSVSIGSRVRVKLSGRMTKGFVTALHKVDDDRELLSIEGVSGGVPSFDSELLESLRWASMHYVAPLSVLLKHTIPPNIPSEVEVDDHVATSDSGVPVGADTPIFRYGSSPYSDDIIATVDPVVASGSGVVVIVPSVAEMDEVSEALSERYMGRVISASSSLPDAAVTRAWSTVASTQGWILVGTREIMLWPYKNAGLVVIVEDGRRVMRSPSTPTLSVREVVLHRSGIESFDVVLLGPLPTLEVINAGVRVDSLTGRLWPRVGVVDRSEDPPGGGLLTERTRASINRSLSQSERVFVLVGSRGYAPAFRCIRCGEIRRCVKCGSAISDSESCRRCGVNLVNCRECGGPRFQALGAGVGSVIDEIRGFIGDGLGVGGTESIIVVGTERDLIGVHDVGLAVAVDVDGLSMAPNYRAGEDALRLLVRLAQTVKNDGATRCLVQTSLPGQEVVNALVSGNPTSYLEDEMASRGRFGFPPVGALIAIETDTGTDAEELLREGLGAGVTILGPAAVRDRVRWLIQGRELGDARIALRPILTTLRRRGAKVRVDVDPFDL